MDLPRFQRSSFPSPSLLTDFSPQIRSLQPHFPARVPSFVAICFPGGDESTATQQASLTGYWHWTGVDWFLLSSVRSPKLGRMDCSRARFVSRYLPWQLATKIRTILSLHSGSCRFVCWLVPYQSNPSAHGSICTAQGRSEQPLRDLPRSCAA